MTSPDGIAWEPQTSAADNEWRSVTYAGGLFVAVSLSGTGNRVMTSGTSVHLLPAREDRGHRPSRSGCPPPAPAPSSTSHSSPGAHTSWVDGHRAGRGGSTRAPAARSAARSASCQCARES